MRRFCCSLLLLAAAAAEVLTIASTELQLMNALDTGAEHIILSSSILLTRPLVLSRTVELRGVAGGDAALLLPSGAGGRSVVSLHSGASGTVLSNLRIAFTGAPSWRLTAALLADGASRLMLTDLAVSGGVLLRGVHDSTLSWSDVSNEFGAQNGTCINVYGCGISRSLTPCNVTVHDNRVHDCRYDGHSPYDASAQGVLIGAQDGAGGNNACAVGVVVRNNELSGIDEMGARVSTDTLCANVLNQVVLNKIKDWGQLNASAGGDRTDSGCLYSYGK